MEFTKVVAERYSCKNFSTRKVEAEKLTEILEAGGWPRPPRILQEQRNLCAAVGRKPGKARQGDALPQWCVYLPRRGLR